MRCTNEESCWRRRAVDLGFMSWNTLDVWRLVMKNRCFILVP